MADFDEFASDANYWDDYTSLETDVNLAGRVYERAVIAPDMNGVGTSFEGTAFTGVFDGDDSKILNLTIYDGAAENDYLGLFGYLGEDSKVKNLGIEGSSVSGGIFAGGLAGGTRDSIISECYSMGDVNGVGYVGGLVGWSTLSIIAGCYSSSDVRGSDPLGGLIAYSDYSTISDCYATGSVTLQSDVTYGHAGGLVGLNLKGYISNCYATGRVVGADRPGGLAGFTSCCVWNSYWDIDASGLEWSAGGKSKTTSQMHRQSSFTEWDFINVWDIGEGQTYPYLRTVSAGDINKDKTVNFLDVCIIAEQWCNGE